MAVLGLLKIKVFWVIIYVHDVTNKNLSCDSNYNVDAIMWTKLGNSSTSIREVIITSIIKGFNQMNQIFERWSWFKLVIWTKHSVWSWNFHQCVKRVRTKSQKVLGANSYICRSYRQKTGRGEGGGGGIWN